MPRELDPFRKYVEHLGNSKWKCKFCGTESHGSAPRIRAHLAGIPGYGIKLCEKVDHCVKAEVLQKMKDKGSMLDISTEGTSSEGTERIVFGASQIVPQSDDALNPDETQNSNQPACAPQQPSCYWLTGIGTASVCPQDQVFLPHGAMSPLDNLYTSQQPNLWNHGLDLSRGNEIASSSQQFPMDLSSLDLSERQALPELLLSSFLNDQVPDIRMSNGSQEFIQCGGLSNPLLMNITPTGTPRYSNEQYPSFHQQFVGGIFPPELSNLQPFLLENLHKSRDEIVNTFEAIQASELHNLTVGSSLQIGSFLDVDGADRLQDCDQPCVAGVVPVRSNMSPTDTVQHPSQLPPRCDKEDGNDISPSRAPMDMNPSIAPQHTIVDSLVREASTNTVGPSSSHALVPPQHQSVPHQSINLQRAHQNPTVPSSLWKNHLVTRHPQALMEMDSCMPSSSEAPNNALPPPQILPCGIGWTGPSSLPELAMSEGAPMMSHPNIGNNFEKNRALKRKLESLYSKEAVIKDELEFAASLLLKKPRKEVAKWLANVEKLRIDCTKAASEGCLPPYQQVDILMHEVEDLRRQGNGLFEVRETKASKLLEGKMVGEAFQKNTIKILEYLGGDQISRLGIYGMGGVGKTTIMVHIYNRLLEKKNYGNVFWITVSQDFNTQRLQDAIGKELGWSISQEKDVRKRAAILHDCLMNRGKSTIFLDDVWECFDLNEVGIPVRADGIKLILTTRSFKICCQMHCQEIIKIEPLSHTEAESLFLEELGSEVALNLEIEPFVKSIVKECAGLPLAIIMMSRSMRGVTDVFEWKDSFERLRESDMGQSDMEKDVLMKLKFSYDRLGNHEVQQCFLSCALYPEDKLINKFELMEFFIDQGLIGQWNTREKQHDRGLTILNILANVCLLEDHGKEMKMHDLIRDMALHIMSATSIVKARKGLRRIPSEEYWTNALEKVSLMENYIGEFPLNMSPNCPKLSTFLMNSNIWYEVAIPDSFFKQLRELKVLNLSKCTLRELPDSISDLVNLRALLLRECWELCRIPYLGKLKSLRKLDIFRCEIVEGLEGLEMLVNLRYLDITRTSIERLPRGTLGALLNLQFLNVQVVNVEDISKLRALETFSCSFEDVDDFNKFVRVVSKQGNEPQYYKLRVDREGSEIYVEANDDARFGNCKRIVCIKSWSHAIVSAGGESKGSGICILIPKDVQKLTASYCNGATNLSDMCPLENLEELDICEWKNLRVLCGEQDEEVINIHDSPTPLLFPCLRVLEIKRCPKLKYLFGHGLKFYLPHLQRIKISTCEELVGITVAATSPPLHLPPAFPSLVYISIWECDKMKRVVESMWLPHFPKLRRIDAHNCENMEEIIGGPPSNLLIEEISLEIFEVANCHNMRKLFPHELLIHLRSLQHIDVYGCKEMVELISGVGQGQEGSIMTLVNNSLSPFQSSISLPKLDSLRPHDLPQLKSICEVPVTCDSLEFFKVLREERDEIINIHHCPVLTRIPTPLVFISLRVLFILNCPKLKYLFGHWPKFSLPHLQDIKICQCQEMVGITVEVMSPPLHSPPAFPSLEGIDIWDCDEMKRAVESEWLPHFPNLRGINVSHCENMEEIIRGPPPYMPVEEISLEWLKVECCHNMRKLFPHEWMLHLRNLQTIKVHRCKGMVEMISGAGQGQDGSIMTHVYNTPSPAFQSSISLPKLKFLWLLDLPRLKSICEVPITCDSIERLEVIKCPEMNRIPLQLQFRDIKDLPYIEVEGEEKWKTLIWDHPDAQALQSRLRFDGNRCILEDGRNSQLSESGSESSDTDFKEV